MARPRAVSVVAQPNFGLLVTFCNNEKRLFDVTPYLEFKPFHALKTPAVFNTIKISGLSVGWVQGQDICPDELYYNSVPV